MSEKKKAVRMSHITFALMLEELLSGPATCKALSEHSGMDHRYVCRFINTLHAKKLVHISAYEGDSLGRKWIRVFALGPGKDAKREKKSRQQMNAEYRAKVAGAVLAGTPWAGMLSANQHREAA